MKKILCLMAGLSAFAALAEDSYIWWMLSEEATVTDSTSTKPIADGTYWARVVGFRADDDYVFNWNNTYLNMATTLDAEGSDWVKVGIGEDANNSAFIAYGAKSTGWKYYVELYNDKTELVYRSREEDQPELYSRDSIAAIGSIATPSNIWSLLNMVPQTAPEPSSGLLMLIGCAALALRRRRQKAVRA